jgi:hypothetical protein
MLGWRTALSRDALTCNWESTAHNDMRAKYAADRFAAFDGT